MAADGYLHGVLADGARTFRYRPRVARLLGSVPDDIALRFVTTPYASSFPYLRPPGRRSPSTTFTVSRDDVYPPAVHMEADEAQWNYVTGSTDQPAPPRHAAGALRHALPPSEPEQISADSDAAPRPPDMVVVEATRASDPIVIPPVIPAGHIRMPSPETARPAATALAPTSPPAPTPREPRAPLPAASSMSDVAAEPPPAHRYVVQARRVGPPDRSAATASPHRSYPMPATAPPTTAGEDAANPDVLAARRPPAVEWVTPPARNSLAAESAPRPDRPRPPAGQRTVYADPDVSAGAIDGEPWDVAAGESVDAAPVAAAAPQFPMLDEPIILVEDTKPAVVPAFWARRHLNRLRPRVLR